MPCLREVLTPRGILIEAFATAITWDRFDDFHTQLMAETERESKR